MGMWAYGDGFWIPACAGMTYLTENPPLVVHGTLGYVPRHPADIAVCRARGFSTLPFGCVSSLVREINFTNPTARHWRGGVPIWAVPFVTNLQDPINQSDIFTITTAR
jgi:hypothetical protein